MMNTTNLGLGSPEDQASAAGTAPGMGAAR
jgi:hypothetical protein